MKKKDIRILLVDDEPDVIEIIRYNLVQEGYSVKIASNGEEALKKAYKKTPHLILMVVMMPKMDGIEACLEIRKDPLFNDTIIMFLSARGEDFSHLAAFDAGADDYVTKPIKPKIIVSKVKSLLRRLKKEGDNLNKIELGKLTIDIDQYQVTNNGKTYSLPRKEFELLHYLAKHIGQVMTREHLLQMVLSLVTEQVQCQLLQLLTWEHLVQDLM